MNNTNPRRRPDLSVNTTRSRSSTKPSSNANAASLSRSSSRSTRAPASHSYSHSHYPSAGTSMDFGHSRSRAPSISHPNADAETFLEMFTPVGPPTATRNPPPTTDSSPASRVYGPGQRDSHDLSLPSRNVRDSLVSNMLLSLDQFSMDQMAMPARSGAPFDDHRLYSLSTTTTDDAARAPTVPIAPRAGGHGHGHGHGHPRYGYNYSSDFDATDNDSRVSGSISHGRRSNSSSGFQSSLGRINSMRELSHRSSPTGTPRVMHSRGGKGSKSSSANSVDAGGYAQVLGSQRWAHGFGGRSSSFDLGARAPTINGAPPATPTNAPQPQPHYQHQPQHYPHHQQHQQYQQQQQSSQTPWHISFSDNFFNKSGGNDYDDGDADLDDDDDLGSAAPNPTVPGGPRKSVSVPNVPVAASYQTPPMEPLSPDRRRSTRSPAPGRQQQPAYTGSAAPVLPAFDLDAAPAPNIGYEKAKEVVPPVTQQQQQQQMRTASHPLREKSSFFKRMFGSLRDTVTVGETAPPVPPPPSTKPAHAAANVDTSRANSSGGQKALSSPPSRDSTHSAHATLQKKPSGFFRRRKKSMSEPQPPLPTAIPPQLRPTPPPPPKATPPPPQDESMNMNQRGPAVSAKPQRYDRFVEQQTAPSPATSLSRVMLPYLKSSSTNSSGLGEPHLHLSLDDDDDDDNEAANAELAGRTVRGFSPDYEPPLTATIRSVDQEPPLESEPRMQQHQHQQQQQQQQHYGTPMRQPPAPPPVHPARTGSFLSDDSDDADNSPRVTIRKTLAEQHTIKPKGSRSHLSPSPSTVDDRHLSPTSARGPTSKKSSASLDTGRAATAGGTKGAGGKVHMPIVKVDGAKEAALSANLIDEPEFVIGKPTEDDCQKALNIFQGSEDFVSKDKAAAWMGEEGPVRQRTLQAYMDLYDFRGQSIVNALRDVCSRLILRAETQQVDRILVCFSKRWCASNPKHGFKSMDIVHTICYSIMLLNTDLHMADIESKMTRSQFIKNTMTTILQTLAEAEAEPAAAAGHGSERTSVDQDRSASTLQLASLPPRAESSLGHHDDCGPLVKAPCDGPMRLWESQMEIVLKIIYTSIRDERLPLFGAEVSDSAGDTASTSHQLLSNLSVLGILKRTPSIISKAPSEGQISTRGRVAEPSARASASRWVSKSRSRVRVPPHATGPNGFSSSRTSLEDANSIWSPTGSSATWSRQSLGRTHASMSFESFGSQWPRGDYKQSIGFANALSQAIIREDGPGGGGGAPSVSDDQSLHRQNTNGLLDDESLELAGPPWIKEGMVTHKHHLDGLDKKAKDRNWVEVFAVVQKGQMSLFSFTPNKTLRAKNRGRAAAKGAVVGGGNWQDNATNLGTFSLKQTLASALPPPGYSRTRPHVWALSLPTGAVHLFHVGTPEICKEFVNTANYWSARLSTHPLVGGISNIEYGWSESIINNPLVTALATESMTTLPTSTSGPVAAVAGVTHGPYPPSASRPGSAAAGRASIASRSSFRSNSFDFGHVRHGSASSGFTASAAAAAASAVGSASSRFGKLPGDRIHIADWTPPTQSLRASSLPEHQQLQTLLAYVQSIEDELQAHNALRSPMLLAFTPRAHNANKAMANWERKSSHLLREIVKYRTYVDCLSEAERRRAEIYHERDIARRAARGDASVHSYGSDAEAEVEVEPTEIVRSETVDRSERLDWGEAVDRKASRTSMA